MISPVFASDTIANHLVINEIFVNPQGIDTGKEWIELYNPTTAPINLAGWRIESAGTIFQTTFQWPLDQETVIGAQNYYLVGENQVEQRDATGELDFQNGRSATDGIRLINNNNAVIDTILYDTPNTNNLPGDISTTNPANTPTEGEALARSTDGSDTDNDNADFMTTIIPTPKTSNITSWNTPTPTPTTTPTATPTPTLTPTATPTPTPPPAPAPQNGSSREQAWNATIAKIRTKSKNDWVMVTGYTTVTPGVIDDQLFYIQDTTGGIQIDARNNTIPSLKLGEHLQIIGKLSESSNEKKINIQENGDIILLPTPHIQTTTPIQQLANIDEQHEGMLLQVEGTITEKRSTTLTLTDSSGALKIQIKKPTGISVENFKNEDLVTIAGILIQEQEDYKLLPRTQEDIQAGLVLGASTSSSPENQSSNLATELPKTGPSWKLSIVIAIAQTITFLLLTTKPTLRQSKSTL